MPKRKKYKLTVADEDVYEYRLSRSNTIIAVLICIVLIIFTIRILL